MIIPAKICTGWSYEHFQWSNLILDCSSAVFNMRSTDLSKLNVNLIIMRQDDPLKSLSPGQVALQ